MASYDNSANTAIDIIFKFIKERMEHLEMSQTELCELTGIYRTTLYRYFKKETQMPLIDYLKICGALKLHPYLVPAEDDDTKMHRMHFN